MTHRRITILGATGSVGGSTLDLVGGHEDRFSIDTLTAHRDVGGLAGLARKYRARHAVIADASLKVLSNYTGGYHENSAETIKSRLFFQLFHPVNWIGCLQTALDDNIELFLEFGGGIGDGDGPTEKRPNLEGMVKKFTRRADPKPGYIPAINSATIREAALISA